MDLFHLEEFSLLDWGYKAEVVQEEVGFTFSQWMSGDLVRETCHVRAVKLHVKWGAGLLPKATCLATGPRGLKV